MLMTEFNWVKPADVGQTMIKTSVKPPVLELTPELLPRSPKFT
jgi:hypothetical protein